MFSPNIGMDISSALTQARSAEGSRLYKEALGLFKDSEKDVESSLYAGLKKEFETLSGRNDFENLLDPVTSIISRFKSGMGTRAEEREKQTRLTEMSKGRTSILAGGDRYEQLLTKEKVNLAAEQVKSKSTLLTANTMTATNTKI